MEAPVAPLQARKQQLVREAIWDAAIELFAARGYDETTVEEIAEAAGISRRSFFRYFASKSELMAHGLFSYGEEIAAAIAACPAGMGVPAMLRETVTRVARENTGRTRTRKIMEIAARYPAAREAQAAGIGELQARVAAAWARRAETAGDPLLPGMLGGMTLAILSVTLRAWFEEGGELEGTVERVFRTLRRLY